MFPSEAGQ